jgi:putative DNA primase/helicase
MDVYDRDRLEGIMFSSLKKTSPDPIKHADPEVSGQPADEGDTRSEEAVLAESPSCRDDAESIITTSESDSAVGSDSVKLTADIDKAVEVVESVSSDLTSDVIVESDEDTIVRLAALPPFQYDRVRLEEAKRLGVQVSTLDAEVKAARNGEPEVNNSPFEDVEPFSKPVDPAELFESISKGFGQLVIITDEQADAMTLWAAHTYMVDLFDVSPLLLFNAPEKACAKTLAQSLVARISYRPLPAANASMSALFRAAVWKPTIFIDEADTFFRDHVDLHGLINAGYKAGGFVLRSEATGDSYVPKQFPVYGPKSIAGIALERHLPDSTMSRGISINMRRKLPEESVERLRNVPTEYFNVLASQLARFALDYAKQIRQARPYLPEELSDRAQDNWEPLLAIASCAGQEWVERATKAAIALSGKSGDSGSTGNELLADIREVFAKKRVGKICSADLISALTTNGEYGWGSYNRGKPLTSRQLAKQLAAYGIRPKNLRFKSATLKGYEVGNFSEVFERYLTPPENPPQRSVSPKPSQGKGSDAADGGEGIRNAAEDAQQDDDLTDVDRAIAAFEAEVAATPNLSPTLGSGGAADAAADGEDGYEDEDF